MYSACATGAGPRTSLSAATVISKIPPPRSIRSCSPLRNARDGLGRCPATSTLPVSTAFLARLRVLKKRAAHSQTSSLTVIACSSSRFIRFAVSCRALARAVRSACARCDLAQTPARLPASSATMACATPDVWATAAKLKRAGPGAAWSAPQGSTAGGPPSPLAARYVHGARHIRVRMRRDQRIVGGVGTQCRRSGGMP